MITQNSISIPDRTSALEVRRKAVDSGAHPDCASLEETTVFGGTSACPHDAVAASALVDAVVNQGNTIKDEV